MSTMRLIDPQLVDAVAAYDPGDLCAENLAAARVLGPTVELSARVVRTDLVVPAAESDVTIRVHRPVGVTGPLPCVFSMHPGGYVLGDRSMDDQRLDLWCSRVPVVGVSVEYRLAPATPYPGPLMDCYTALTWTHDHAEKHGIDRSRIGLHGIGAGGGLAAALAIVARDHREVPLAFQLLDSPMLDDRQRTHSSRVEDLPVWSAKSNEFGWRAYLGDLYGSDEVPKYAAAARCTNLRGLPPAFVSVGSLDGFHDEDVDYATRLNHAGVPTELHVYPGTPHGYHVAAGSDIVRRSTRHQVGWLRRQVSR